jgi:hypothetical protein
MFDDIWWAGPFFWFSESADVERLVRIFGYSSSSFVFHTEAVDSETEREVGYLLRFVILLKQNRRNRGVRSCRASNMAHGRCCMDVTNFIIVSRPGEIAERRTPALNSMVRAPLLVIT